ncbi:MAG: hypothetical protein HC828_16510, partial [Blastochloris sp.]|nr:hypothetical protein [Blastochloris sp.]
MSASAYVILYFITASICAALAYLAWRRQEEEPRILGLLMGALAFWSACHAVASAQTTLEGMLFWTTDAIWRQ